MAFGSHYNTCHCIWIGCANFLQRDSVQRMKMCTVPSWQSVSCAITLKPHVKTVLRPKITVFLLAKQTQGT